MNISPELFQQQIDDLRCTLDHITAHRNGLRDACEAALGHLRDGDGNSFDLSELAHFQAQLIDELEDALEPSTSPADSAPQAASQKQV